MRNLCIAASLVTLLAAPINAETIEGPSGDVLLTLSGDVQNETSGGVVELDIDMLKAMPSTRFSTTTIWVEGSQDFTGVSLKHVLKVAGIETATIEAVALNDYKVEIPVDSIEDDAPIIAYEMNGKKMSSRDKGPLWIVYPYESDPKYRTEVVYSRSIWQLNRIVAVP